MMPFFFGTRQRRLFGVYEPAHTGPSAGRAALICAPWGNEYIYSHRTLRQLALRLSHSGFHVLRFDYYATGDSGGDCGETDHAGTCEDARTAMDELREIANVAKVSLIGLRFGASVAAEMAADSAGQVEALITWEPLNWDALPASGERRAEPAQAPAGFKARRLDELASQLPKRSLVVLMQEPEPHFAAPLDVRRVPGDPPWLESNVQAGTIPVAALTAITEWVS